MNILTKLSQWYLTRQQKIQQKKQIKGQDKTTIKVYNDLKQLYHFVKWLNTKGLGNRHQKKAFWSKVKNNEPILETTLQNIINQYTKRIYKAKATKAEDKSSKVEKK